MITRSQLDSTTKLRLLLHAGHNETGAADKHWQAWLRAKMRMQRESLSLFSYSCVAVSRREPRHTTHTTSQQLHQHTVPSSLFVKNYRRPPPNSCPEALILSLFLSDFFFFFFSCVMCVEWSEPNPPVFWFPPTTATLKNHLPPSAVFLVDVRFLL